MKYKCMYENQIVRHNPNFSLFVVHNSFDNQGSKININDIFLRSGIRKLLSY